MTAVNGVASFSGLSLVDPGSFSIQVKSGTAAPATIGPIDRGWPDRNVSGATSRLGPRLHPSCSANNCVLAGKGKNRYVAGIVLTFSSALDPATARNASNYSVIQVNQVPAEPRPSSRFGSVPLYKPASTHREADLGRQAPLRGRRPARPDRLGADRHRQHLRRAPRRQHGKQSRRRWPLHDLAERRAESPTDSDPNRSTWFNCSRCDTTEARTERTAGSARATATAAVIVTATASGSSTRTIAFAGTLTTTRIGMKYVKKVPSGSAQRPAKISRG